MKAISSIDSICDGISSSADAVKLYVHSMTHCDDRDVLEKLTDCCFSELQNVQSLAIALTDCFVEKKRDDEAKDK